MSRFGVIGPAYQSQSPLADIETLINWYVENMESAGAKSAAATYPRPGLTQFADLGALGAPHRGLLELSGRVYLVVGATAIVLLDNLGNFASMNNAGVGADQYPASLAASRTNLVIVSNGQAFYSSTLGAVPTLTQIPSNTTGSAYAIKTPGASARVQTTVNITSATQSGYIVTLVTNGVNLETLYAAGDVIVVAGVGVAGYNGTFQVSYVKGNIVQYTTGVSGLANSSGGTCAFWIVEIDLSGKNREFDSQIASRIRVAGNSVANYNADWQIESVSYVGGPLPATVLICQATIAIVNAAPATGGGGTATVLLTPAMVNFCDGYFILTYRNSQTWALSALEDPSTWNGTQVSQISTIPDNIVGTIVDHREVIHFGRGKSVIYGDSGNTFPFDVIPGAFIEDGAVSAFGQIRADNSVFWLARDERGQLVAKRLNGYVGARVSTHAIEQEWQGYSRADDVIAMSYQWNGHTFVQWYFPTGNTTWVYDVATGTWHKDAYWNGASYDAHRIAFHCEAFGLHLVGDRQSGILYKLDASNATDNNALIRWERTAPTIATEAEMLTFERLILDVEDPVAAPAASNIILSWSDDSGTTFPITRVLDTSQAGRKKARVLTLRMGRSRKRTYRLVTFYALRLIDGYVNASPDYQPKKRLSKQLQEMA